MNNQNLMMLRKSAGSGTPEYARPETEPEAPDYLEYQAGGMMVSRDTVQDMPVPVQPVAEAALEKQIVPPPAPVRQNLNTNSQAAVAAANPKAKAAQAVKASGQKASQPVVSPPQKPAPAQATQAARAAKPAQAPKITPGKPIGIKKTPDALCQTYITAFKDSLGLDLSASICFENMRKLCECDVKNPDKALYFIENTYRVSTVLYLAANLPIIVIASILAEKNRKNIVKYVATEVENGAKPYDELRALRLRRWARKYENMGLNDGPTVTPGATGLSDPLAAAAMASLKDISIKLRRFNKELTDIVSRFDDAARNDVVYIYSNWWYLLQGFENVPEMRSYIMAITDDTRRNLKV